MHRDLPLPFFFLEISFSGCLIYESARLLRPNLSISKLNMDRATIDIEHSEKLEQKGRLMSISFNILSEADAVSINIKWWLPLELNFSLIENSDTGLKCQHAYDVAKTYAQCQYVRNLEPCAWSLCFLIYPGLFKRWVFTFAIVTSLFLS